jgi:hypothetical protein
LSDLLYIDFESEGHPRPWEILRDWPENLDQEIALFRVLERGLIDSLEEASDVGHLGGWDRSNSDVPSMAAHPQNAHHTGFFPIVRTIADLWDRIALKDPTTARTLIAGWTSSPYLILRRLFLFGVAAKTAFSGDDAWAALAELEDKIFWGAGAQVEIMRVATERWPDFAAPDREKFEARIQAGLPRELFPPEAFANEADWLVVKDSAADKRLARLKSAGWPLSAASQAALDEIASRRPEWAHGPGDRDDFAVWHESRSGPTGQTELLAGVKDGALVSEAMRLQRDRAYDQRDIWRLLTDADPERAFRGLKLEANTGRFESVAWRDLLWAMCDKGDAATQFEVAAALLSMPAATLEELLAPATSWLQRRRESLKGDNPPNETIFLRVWDRLATLAYPQDGGPIEEVERDLTSSALNDPAGLLAWTLLNDILDQSPVQNGELRPQYSTRLNVAVNADGRPGLLARVLLVGSLANLESIARVGRRPISCRAFPGTGHTLRPFGAHLPAADMSAHHVYSTL